MGPSGVRTEGTGRRKGPSMVSRARLPSQKNPSPGPAEYQHPHSPPSKRANSRTSTAPEVGIKSSWQRYALNSPPGFGSFWVNEGNSRHPQGEFTSSKQYRPQSVDSTFASSQTVRFGTESRSIATISTSTGLHARAVCRKVGGERPGPLGLGSGPGLQKWHILSSQEFAASLGRQAGEVTADPRHGLWLGLGEA